MTGLGGGRRLPCGSWGFSLVEVVVGLLVLELGLLGVAGLAVHSLRVLSESALRSRAVTVAGEVADSLVAAGRAGGGERPFEGGFLAWSPDEGADAGLVRITIRALRDGGDPLFRLHLLVPLPSSGSQRSGSRP